MVKAWLSYVHAAMVRMCKNGCIQILASAPRMVVLVLCPDRACFVWGWDQSLIFIFVSLQKHLGYFNHIFRLSQLHQYDQEMLPNRFAWKFIEELSLVTLANPFFQNTYLATFLAFLTTATQPGNKSMQMYKIKEATNLTRNAGL